ncbi:SPFH domain-containing protein [Thermophilibacter mediterraneus]|uniref:SPFH domain-containing protein n=1 Tax=Thermophilibacter mediterraneus TaxID=1871031 RepID=UPI00320A48F3
MGILDAAFDSLGGVLADQWKDVVTAAPFDEHTAVAPGIRKSSQNGRGANMGAEDILSNGSIIFVPENTAAFIFSQAGIEQVITQPGGFEYRDGEASVFDEQDRREKGLGKIILDQAVDRIGFSGMSSEEKRVAFVNLREMRGLKFGTRGPLAYNDLFYGTDLEVFSYGSFSVQVSDPELFVRNFVPANVSSYSLDDPQARSQLLSEFLNSFIAAVNSLSATYRVSQLPSQTNEIAAAISSEDENAGTWPERFGLRLAAVAIENIEFSDESRELVRQFSEKKMGVRAYEDVSQRAANVAAQQMIAQGVRDNGLGDGGGMLFGMNLAQSLNPQNASTPSSQGSPSATSLDDQIETLKKLKDLLDLGILSQQEFDAKKREILGL